MALNQAFDQMVFSTCHFMSSVYSSSSPIVSQIFTKIVFHSYELYFYRIPLVLYPPKFVKDVTLKEYLMLELKYAF